MSGEREETVDRIRLTMRQSTQDILSIFDVSVVTLLFFSRFISIWYSSSLNAGTGWHCFGPKNRRPNINERHTGCQESLKMEGDHEPKT